MPCAPPALSHPTPTRAPPVRAGGAHKFSAAPCRTLSPSRPTRPCLATPVLGVCLLSPARAGREAFRRTMERERIESGLVSAAAPCLCARRARLASVPMLLLGRNAMADRALPRQLGRPPPAHCAACLPAGLRYTLSAPAGEDQRRVIHRTSRVDRGGHKRGKQERGEKETYTRPDTTRTRCVQGCGRKR